MRNLLHYEVLMARAAVWPGTWDTDGKKLHQDAADFVDFLLKKNNKLLQYAILIEAYIIQKGGLHAIIQKKARLGYLQWLSTKTIYKTSNSAKWILGKVYHILSIDPNLTPKERSATIVRAAEIFSEIQDEVILDYPILLPGVENDVPVPFLNNLFEPLGAPIVHTQVIPYRFQSVSDISAADAIFKMGGRKDTVQNLLDRAERSVVERSHQKFDYLPLADVNQTLIKNTILGIKVGFLGENESINKIKVLDNLDYAAHQDYTTTEKISATKAREYRAVMLAGLAFLESDPIKSGDVLIELHKEIATIRNQRNNKIEFFSIDPFYRLAHKNPDALQLFNDLTAIKPIPDDHAKTEEEKSNVYFCATYTSHLKGDLIMGDKYVNNGQAGAVGANAKSDGNSFFQTQSSFKNKPNLEAVIEELGKLRDEMRKLSTDIEHDSSIVAVGQAIIAGDKKDLSSVLVHLKSAGKWALSISEKLGLKIAEKLILDAIEQ